jgi:adenylate kinase
LARLPLCRAFVAYRPEFIHLTASNLISQSTGKTVEELTTATSDEILRNQIVLSRSLEAEARKLNGSNIILDGLCVIDNGTQLVVLPTEVIALFRPTALILLEAEPEEILRRRAKDHKYRPLRTAAELANQMEVNRATVRRYAHNLEIPFASIRK